MAAISAELGATYIQVFPPNQYPTKREFSPEEAKIALRPKHKYTVGVRALYLVQRT